MRSGQLTLDAEWLRTKAGGVGLIISTLTPIFLLIALGVVLTRAGFLVGEFLKGLNRFVYWVALPASLFESASAGGYHFGGAGRIVLVMALATLPAIALAYAYVKVARLGTAVAGTLMHVAMRGNLSYIGLPVMLYLAADPHLVHDGTLRSLAILAFAPCMLFQNIAGVAVLLVGRHPSWLATLREIVKSVVTNPLLIAVAAGLLLAWSGQSLPLALKRCMVSVGGIASPLALIGIGGALAVVKLRGRWQPPLIAALLKVGVVPALGWLACLALALGHDERCIALVFLACPTAAASYPMIVEMGGDEASASSAIFMSTVLSLFSLSAVLALL